MATSSITNMSNLRQNPIKGQPRLDRDHQKLNLSTVTLYKTDRLNEYRTSKDATQAVHSPAASETQDSSWQFSSVKCYWGHTYDSTGQHTLCLRIVQPDLPDSDYGEWHYQDTTGRETDTVSGHRWVLDPPRHLYPDSGVTVKSSLITSSPKSSCTDELTINADAVWDMLTGRVVPEPRTGLSKGDIEEPSFARQVSEKKISLEEYREKHDAVYDIPPARLVTGMRLVVGLYDSSRSEPNLFIGRKVSGFGSGSPTGSSSDNGDGSAGAQDVSGTWQLAQLAPLS